MIVQRAKQSAKTALLDGYRNWRIYSARSPRSEFWWWALYVWTLAVIAAWIKNDLINWLFILLILPAPAVWVRRIHDTGHRIWWCMIPGIGLLMNLVMLCSPTAPLESRWQSANSQPRSNWWIEDQILRVVNWRPVSRQTQEERSAAMDQIRTMFRIPGRNQLLVCQIVIALVAYNVFKVLVEPRSDSGACGSLLRPIVKTDRFSTRIGWLWEYSDARCARMMSGRLWELILSLGLLAWCTAFLRKEDRLRNRGIATTDPIP
jgi:uncharacterized membrane protein YhaH (DUF805 family)